MNSDALAYLAAKGLTLEEVIEFARLAERKKDATNAERQARHRAKRNAVTVTRDPNKEIPPTPPKEINPSPPVFSDENTPPPVLELVSDNSEPAKLMPRHVAEAWNAMCDRTGLAKVRTIEGARERRLRSLIAKHPIEDFTEAIDAVERAHWMHGENARGWRASFKFFLANFTEILEGTYDKSAA